MIDKGSAGEYLIVRRKRRAPTRTDWPPAAKPKLVDLVAAYERDLENSGTAEFRAVSVIDGTSR